MSTTTRTALFCTPINAALAAAGICVESRDATGGGRITYTSRRVGGATVTTVDVDNLRVETRVEFADLAGHCSSVGVWHGLVNGRGNALKVNEARVARLAAVLR